MTVEITRSYPNITVAKLENGLTDVVKSVRCIVMGVESGIQHTVGAEFVLPPPELDQFIEFEDITKELCDSWIIETDQYKELENGVIDYFEARKNLEVVPPPFS
jgi:hypothetical protein